ncbi:SpoIID/LytB domain protein [Thermodesulfitimonas autotrophica]|uniref:SpoIID/LytB domain protein n=1 Tax=Thermodesulfitimonas autotrophica TaxID=1894989 RepID=A0A3N5AXF7_9THEO|nr:SpoIID/LytB domain-containing protein [Thermodesulfitimonas autotrophica]RPF49709.1 SpoIID/LytB domain protein [Thermodesulfitimonas autotrophica]
MTELRKAVKWVLVAWLVLGFWGVLVFLLPRAAGAAELVVQEKGSVNIRQGPGTGYAVIARVAPGTKLVSLAAQAGWFKVRLATGQTGWVAGWLVKPAVSAPAGGGISQSPAAVVVTGERVNLRRGPGTGYAITGQATKGTQLAVAGRSGDWYKVKLREGQLAWVAGWLVKPILAAQVEKEGAGQASEKNAGQGATGALVVKGDVVNLRTGPGTGYGIVGRMARGLRLELLEARDGWYKVRLATGQTGWVAGWLVEAVPEVPAAQPPAREETVSRGPAPEAPAQPQVPPFTARAFTRPVRVLLAADVPAAVSVYGDYALVDGLTGNVLFRTANTDQLGLSLTVLPEAAVDQTVYAIALEKNRQFLGNFAGPLVLAEGSGATGNYFTLNTGGGSRRYRGNLIVRLQGGKFLLVNELPIEEYLYGVVPCEMPYRWPAEALKAQAVAARSYALRKVQESEDAPFHVYATQADQVYGGMDAERPETTAAIKATEGLVLKYGGEVVTAYFHSSDGGYTENSEDVWRNWCGYIRGKADPYDRHPENPHYGWSVSYSVYDLARCLQERQVNFSVVTAVYVTGKTAVSGRIKQLEVHGTGPDGMPCVQTLRNADWVRCVFRLKAPAADIVKTYDPLTGALVGVTFTGNGWGHALGMSQWGARTMAEQGLNFRDILNFYYTGATLEHV